MGLFICAKCNCVENTALGHYWSRNNVSLKLSDNMKQYEKGAALCSECMPADASFSDGSGKGRIGTGKWHGKFPKQNYDDWKNTDEGKLYVRQGDYLMYNPRKS
jgi:hypothetical protein